nr:anti-sigma factor domain-containing protein [Sedimentibacter sp.]
MRAVVVEAKDKYVAVLSMDGRIYKIKNDNYTIGQEIEIKKHLVNNNRFIKIAATVAASIMLFAVPAWAYLTPYSYVSLDVNPSLEYTVNIFDRVLSVRAVNDDGERFLEKINLDDLKNKNIEVAVQEVVNGIIETGFFEKGQEDGIVIAASSKNNEKSQELADKLKSAVEEKVEEESIGSEVEIEAISVGEERVQKAEELGVTPGKLNIVEKLQESSENPDDIIVEDWLKKPVKEIMKATKENKKTENSEKKQEVKTEDKKYNSESDQLSITDKDKSKVENDKDKPEKEKHEKQTFKDNKEDKKDKDNKDNNGSKKPKSN